MITYNYFKKYLQMKFALKKSPVVELRQKAFKKSTENSQGFKVNYE